MMDMDIRQVIPRDAIPSIDDPTFSPTYFGDPSDEVIVLEGEPPRAYGVRVLDYHEVVNDTHDGQAVAVTWCPLCGSAFVYSREVADELLTFGVSGKLADDDLVLYDRETESEWKQSLGRAIAGPLEGTELTVLPARLTTAARFADDHPDGEYLEPPGTPSEAASDSDNPAPVEYDDSPYQSYIEADGFGLGAHRESGEGRSWTRDDLGPKAVVLGLEFDDVVRGYPLAAVEAAGGIVTDRLGATDVLVVAGDDGIHAYQDPGFEWDLQGEQLRADGTRWDPGTGAAADGRRLERLPARRVFAFTWQDDHGPDAFWSAA
jgi:hypothetical protein